MHLLDGIIEFQNDYFKENEKLFTELGETQKPHTLYIGCSDSRIVPNIITNTPPGELFVVRNIGNMVPPYSDKTTDFHCTNAVIEYAIEMLGIKNIIICGHSNCGACKAFYYNEEKFKDTPNLRKWIKLGENIKNRVLKKNLSDGEKYFQTEQLNIIQQIDNLEEYPFIKNRKDINIIGWYFVIETGEIFNYNYKNRKFELITKDSGGIPTVD